jgi:hypothetical protein
LKQLSIYPTDVLNSFPEKALIEKVRNGTTRISKVVDLNSLSRAAGDHGASLSPHFDSISVGRSLLREGRYSEHKLI